MPRPAASTSLFWVGTSLVLHAALLAILAEGTRGPSADAAPPMWMEPLAPEPPPAPPPPPPAPRIAPPPLKKVATKPRSPAPPPAPAPPAPSLRAPVVDGPSSIAVQPGAGQLGMSGTSRAEHGEPGGTGDGSAASEEPARTLGPAQLSLALDPPQLERLALMRPTIALLMAVPGYADILRGSGIRPLSDLSRLRVRMQGLTPERLLLAGVHTAGEAAIASAAERVAAMRAQAPVWRDGDALRATSWVDGSGIDRGLALHASAFVIGERAALPSFLRGAGAVAAASQLRERVAAQLAIEDAPRYLPGAEACKLQALRISIAERSGGAATHRMLLTAQYETASDASAAAGCWNALSAGSDATWKTLAQWLARAQREATGFGARLEIGVNSDDIQRLFDELAFALRSARRA